MWVGTIDPSSMPDGVPPPEEAPLLVLGAGYAGLTLAEEVRRRSKGKIPVRVVDRHPVHVLRTQLYEIGRLAGAGGDLARWTVPLDRAFSRTGVEFVEGTVEEIDLGHHRVRLAGREESYRALAICLGNVASFYGVPGALEHTHSVYRLSGAQRFAEAVLATERRSADLPGERRPRVVVVGGGSTGTEVAAEIATTDWGRLVGGPVRPPDVTLVTGSLPFLAGFPPRLIDHARRVLRDVGVTVIPGVNVSQVEPGRVHLEDGTVLVADPVLWCAGMEAPPPVRALPVPHGRGGRLATEPTLELPGHPGVFAVGDVVEFRDPNSGLLAPSTAQAALSEARLAARNLVARLHGGRLEEYQYREHGVIVALGVRRGAGSIGGISLWGSPARLLKQLVEREYSRAAGRGEPPGVL